MAPMQRSAGTVLAHAFGERYDLPIPLYLFILGGALVVVASFLLVVRRAPTQALGSAGLHAVRPADASTIDGSHLRGRHAAWGVAAVLWLAFLCWCGTAGSQETSENIIATWFWIIVWIAVPISCALLGDWTQPVNPFAFLAKVADSDRARTFLLSSPEPVRWPAWLGWWPATATFLFLALSELVFNLWATVPRTTALILAGYAAISALGGLLFGREWLRRGEMFTVLYDTWGRLGLFRFGSRGRRGFAGGVDVPFAREASRVTFVLLLLLNVNFDGLLATPQWSDLLRGLPGRLGVAGTNPQRWFNVLAFVAMAFVLAMLLTVFAQGSARFGGHGTRPLSSLAGLLPSLVPIALGYLIAHNLQYLLVNGQLMAPLLGNPPGLPGWPLAGHLPYPLSEDFVPNATFLSSRFYWYASLVLIVAVHVYAVVLAHQHLARRSIARSAELRSEVPWLVAMVGYTCLSLWLLAQPLVAVTQTTSGA